MEIKKILMVTMQMGIGGAETHILELCRALAKKGYKVDVASRGGSFVSELEAAGVRHFAYPLNTRKPLDMIASYKGLEKLILEEKYDVVHAHSRIPAAICGMLARKHEFRFVTTAHWVFTLNPVYKLLSDWGQRTLAVSEDIKQYLIDGYGVFPDNIRVTVNGLDTDKFSPDIDSSSLREELGLAQDSFNVVCVSRMDKSRGEVPLLLASVAGKLRERYKNLNVILVGGSALGGEDSVIPEIEALCEEYKERLGESPVIMCGPRTDINRFASLCDVFVGASRAALEAMSAEKPVILAGNEGYTGILDEGNLEESVSTNFCCRGHEPATESKLFGDISVLAEASTERRAALGAENRKFILKNYSMDRMVNDAVAVYGLARPIVKHPKVIISGYYGFGNAGDDSLLTAITGELCKELPDMSFGVLAKNPRKDEKRFGVKCVNRFNVFAVNSVMRTAELFISGGGNLLQNGTSNKSLAYYVAVLRMAQKKGLKTMQYANGIGPLYGKWAEKLTAKAVANSDVVTVREPDSGELLHKLLPASGNVSVSADPAFLLDSATEERVDFILKKYDVPADKKYVIISLRSVLNKKEKFTGADKERFEEEFAAELAETCAAYDLYPLFIPMQESYDGEICRKVMELAKKGKFISGLTVSEMLALIPRAQFVCGMRLHSLIYSLAAGVPFIALSYDKKVRSFAEYASMPYIIDVPDDWEQGALLGAASDLIKNRSAVSALAKEKAVEFRRLAKSDVKKAAALSGKHGH